MRGPRLLWEPARGRAFPSAGLADPARELSPSAVIASVRLVAVDRTEDIRDHLTEEERAVGFCEDARFALGLADGMPLGDPIPAAGMLGPWEWDRP